MSDRKFLEKNQKIKDLNRAIIDILPKLISIHNQLDGKDAYYFNAINGAGLLYQDLENLIKSINLINPLAKTALKGLDKYKKRNVANLVNSKV